jgi:hypothetical protein
VATTTNFGWTTPDNTGYVKDGALAIRTLGNSIDTTLVDLKGGTTDQVLKKASGTDMDFVWGTVSSTPRIGQVVTATTTSSTSATGGAGMTDVSGLSVTITPTLSTSKILIVTAFTIVSSSGSGQSWSGQVQLVRGSTALSTRLAGGYYPSGGGVNTAAYSHCDFSYVDSPATTSATTYKMQINNVFSVNSFAANGDSASVQISAMEILV